MELAAEPGSGPAHALLSSEGNGLRREHRLPRRTRPEQECDPCARARLHLGQEPRTHLRPRPYRRGQELCRFGPGAESVSRWLLGVLREECSIIPRSEPGTSRRQPPAAVEAAKP